MREGSSGFAAVAKAAVAALLFGVALTACGQQTGYGTLIGVRSVPTTAPGNTVLDTTALIDALNNELNAVNQTSPITDENAQFQKQFNALLTLKQSERLAAIQQLGAQIISTRLTAIAQVRRQVLLLPINDGPRFQIVNLLDSAAIGLRNMQVKIAQDTLVDVARVDVKHVAAFRVYGLLLPQCHMLIAAYDFQKLVGVYTTQKGSLQNAINKASAQGAPVSVIADAQAAVNDLGTQIAAINRYSSSAIATLPALSPSGYPGNRGTVTAIRNQLNAASTASNNAANDVLAAKAVLGIG